MSFSSGFLLSLNGIFTAFTANFFLWVKLQCAGGADPLARGTKSGGDSLRAAVAFVRLFPGNADRIVRTRPGAKPAADAVFAAQQHKTVRVPGKAVLGAYLRAGGVGAVHTAVHPPREDPLSRFAPLSGAHETVSIVRVGQPEIVLIHARHRTRPAAGAARGVKFKSVHGVSSFSTRHGTVR